MSGYPTFKTNPFIKTPNVGQYGNSCLGTRVKIRIIVALNNRPGVENVPASTVSITANVVRALVILQKSDYCNKAALINKFFACCLNTDWLRARSSVHVDTMVHLLMVFQMWTRALLLSHLLHYAIKLCTLMLFNGQLSFIHSSHGLMWAKRC